MRTSGEVMQSKVLAALKSADAALSAYEILEALRNEFPKIAPPTVYRALATLTDKGTVHRVESLNAFVACNGHSHDHASIMSICDDCGSVEESEAPNIFDDLSGHVGKTGFDAHRHVVEVHGVCAACGSQDNAS